jgi:hypothetical protein
MTRMDHQDFADRSCVPPLCGGTVVLERQGGVTYTNVPHLVVHHSPSGYEWGYGGSGPADLALNILEWVLRDAGHQGPRVRCFRGACFRRAWHLHQEFKRDVIADVPRAGGTIGLATIQAWLAAHPDD